MTTQKQKNIMQPGFSQHVDRLAKDGARLTFGNDCIDCDVIYTVVRVSGATYRFGEPTVFGDLEARDERIEAFYAAHGGRGISLDPAA